jgi:hypothetical protein
VCEELRLREAELQDSDPVTAAFSGAFADFIVEDPTFRHALEKSVRFKESNGEPLGAYYTCHMLHRLMQATLIEQPDYPYAYADKVMWQGAITRLLEDEEKQKNFCLDLVYWDVGTNKSERGVAYRLMQHLYKDRFGDRPRYMDVGSSRGHIIAALDIADYVFRLPEVYTGSPEDNEIEVDPTLTSEIARLINWYLPIGRSVCIDAWPRNDEEVRLFKRACSFDPPELLNPANLQDYERLDQHQSSNITYIEELFDHPGLFDPQDGSTVVTGGAEVSGPPMYEFGQEFSFVTICSLMYQLAEERRRRVFDNALRYSPPNGIVMVQDFTDWQPPVDEQHPVEQLSFPSRWRDPSRPFSYRTMIFDKTQPDLGFQELFRWNNGRCQQLILGDLALHRMEVLS